MSVIVDRLASVIMVELHKTIELDITLTLAKNIARANIAAMREPTTAMIEAEPADDEYFSKDNSAAQAKLFWQAMIDEALK